MAPTVASSSEVALGSGVGEVGSAIHTWARDLTKPLAQFHYGYRQGAWSFVLWANTTIVCLSTYVPKRFCRENGCLERALAALPFFSSHKKTIWPFCKRWCTFLLPLLRSGAASQFPFTIFVVKTGRERGGTFRDLNASSFLQFLSPLLVISKRCEPADEIMRWG